MKAKTERFEGRAEYLRALLSKTLTPEQIDPPRITYDHVTRASSSLLEYWQLVRKADLENALRQPAGQAAAKQSKDNTSFTRFSTGQGWTPEEHKEMLANIERLVREYPAFVRNQANGEALAVFLLDKRLYPTYTNLVTAFTTLVCEGRLLLNPSAVGIPEGRYGDSIEGAYQTSRVNASDLKLLTTPYTARPVNDESKLSADQYWAAHPELAAERHKHNRAVIEGEAVRKAESEVERFLQTQLNYQPTDNNKALMLDYLQSHNLPLTAEALFEAFRALKSQLAQSDKGLDYGSTRVIDCGPERSQNPSYIPTELKDSIRRKIARYTSSQYHDWLVRHPDEAAILDEG